MKGSLGDWIIVIILLGAFPPLGVFLLFWNLREAARSGTSSRKRHPYDIQQEQQYHYTGEELKQRRPKEKKTRGPAQLNLERGKLMTVGGGIMAALFGVGGVSMFLDYLSWGGLSYAWSELIWVFSLCVAGLVICQAGLSRTRKGKRFKKYLNLVGRQEKVSVATLSTAMGRSYRKVCDDLEEMLERGAFPVGYIDYGNGVLVLNDEGVREPEKPKPKTPQEEEAENNAILREIRQINDVIPDPVMSAKIDRIEVITGKILEYQRNNPGKDSELRSFLDYYLPTTLKILRSYAQLDAQGVNGENIQAAKTRIEGMMDKVVEGFEKQLDRLFRTETMDITSDVQVLEQMLKKDGLSGDGTTLQL